MADTAPDTIGVYLGLDVGKGEHHARGLTPAGKTVLDKRLPNSEPRLRAILEKLRAKHGHVLLVVDQPASIGALPLAVARAAGCAVAYLPGLTMRRIADLYPGEAKTDARDAAVIADAARTMPHTLRDLAPDDDTVAALSMVAGHDDDLAVEATRTRNRLRGLLTQLHPALERVLGPRADHPAVLKLLERHPTPARIRRAGRSRLVELLRPEAPRMAQRLIGDVFAALDEQTVVVAGTEAAATVIANLAASLRRTLDQRKGLQSEIEALPPGPPSFAGPDLDARNRGQDRGEDPDRRGRRLGLCFGGPSGLLCRARPGHPLLGSLDQGRGPAKAGQQTTQTRVLPGGVRVAGPSALAVLLRPQDRPGQTPWPSAAVPGQTTLRRTVRHAARRLALPTSSHPDHLTKP
ncbi:hypothetical protein GCM10022402_50160 [Salinactinospora qingdaonensis]|uniref:Transposase IS110-like N-terminal domain-containing protein n=1 Tax=Salinactinospora qingdaonensis TaxID=702744 RepID=A0ABP7GKX6_9ACTN